MKYEVEFKFKVLVINDEVDKGEVGEELIAKLTDEDYDKIADNAIREVELKGIYSGDIVSIVRESEWA